MAYKKHALVKIGNICNSNCIGCSISSGEAKREIASLEELKKEVLGLKDAGFESIELIGGEITLEKHFFELMELCRANFEHVNLTTNGRILAYEKFVKKLIKFCPGLNIEIAIHGADSKTHDAFTRTPNSFIEMIRGLQNVIKYRKYFGVLGINTLITNINKDKIQDILNLIREYPGINEWYLLTFAPVKGRALKHNKILTCRYSEIKDINKIVKEAAEFLDCVDLNEFPHCMFDDEVHNNPKIHFIESDRVEVDENGIISSYNPTFSFNQVGYLSNISATKYLKELKEIHSKIRTKDLDECKKCRYNKECGGIWKQYADLFSEKEVNDELRRFKMPKKKVLFVTIDSETLKKIYPLQIAYLISYANKSSIIKKDYNFEVINEKIHKVKIDDIVRKILLRNTAIVCFSAYLWNIEMIEELAKKIKEKDANIKIIIGGPQADIEMGDKPYLDFIIIGEGEIPFKELLENGLDKEKLIDKKGICFNFSGNRIFNGEAKVKNLDEIPSPFLNNIFDIRMFDRIYLETMKGCPYDCAFCSEKARHPEVRFFSLDRIKKELGYILSIPNDLSIEIIDDNFNLVRDRYKSIVDTVKTSNKKRKTIQITLNHYLLRKEDITDLKDAGMTHIEIGLQTVNKEAYKHLNRSELDIQGFKEKIELFDKDFTLFINLIIGLPGDNLEGYRETIKFLTKDIKTKAIMRINSEILKVLPGTIFERQTEKFKLEFDKEPPYNLKSNYSFSEDEISKALELDKEVRKEFGISSASNQDELGSSKVFIRNLSKFCAYSSITATKVLLFLEKNGYEISDAPEDSSCILINGCGLFSKERKRTSAFLIKYLQTFKDKKIILFGCVMDTQYFMDEYLKQFNITIIKNNELDKFNTIFHSSYKIEDINPNVIDSRLAHKQYDYYILIISTGCIERCNYCPYPMYRGPLKSKMISEIVGEFKHGLEEGHKNFFIYSDNIYYYGLDNDESFCGLLNELLKVEADFKLNIENVHPKFIIENLERLKQYLASGKIKFLDVPVQSGSDRILKLMNRGYSVQQIISCITDLKQLFPDIWISTDIIYCFPTETKDDFQKSIDIAGIFDHVTFHKFDKNSKSIRLQGKFTKEDLEYREKTVKEIGQNFSKSKRPFF